jgi:hypothetical protein
MEEIKKMIVFLLKKWNTILLTDVVLFYFIMFFLIHLIFKFDLRDIIPILKDIILAFYDLLLKDWINLFQEYFNNSRLAANIQRWLLSFKKDVPGKNVLVVENVLAPWDWFRQAVVETIDIKDNDTYFDVACKTWLKCGPAILLIGFLVVAYYIKPPGSDD